jgi:hypothetical protein
MTNTNETDTDDVHDVHADAQNDHPIADGGEPACVTCGRSWRTGAVRHFPASPRHADEILEAVDAGETAPESPGAADDPHLCVGCWARKASDATDLTENEARALATVHFMGFDPGNAGIRVDGRSGDGVRELLYRAMEKLNGNADPDDFDELPPTVIDGPSDD